jgi:hypothetical protein
MEIIGQENSDIAEDLSANIQVTENESIGP